MKKIITICISAILLSLPCSQSLFAQAGIIDTSFNAKLTLGNVYTAPVQNDGKILVGGNLDTCYGTAVNNLVRLNANGTLDVTFNAPSWVNSDVFTAAIQTDGKILIGGDFCCFGGPNYIARLNADGSLDPTFNIGDGTSLNVYAICIQPNGKVVIGGFFSTYNDSTANNIARLNADGTLDTTFKTGTGADADILAMALQPDGKIIIGGDFANYNGTPVNYLARIDTDGSLDTTFNMGFGPSNNVQCIAVQSDGKIIIGGTFIQYNAINSSYVARISTDGSFDATFNTGTGIIGSVVDAVSIQPDGKIVIGGYFTGYNGDSTVNYLTRLNTNGSLDTTFNTAVGPDDGVNTVSIEGDGKIFAGGDFFNYDGISRNSLARVFACTYPKPGAITASGCPGSVATYIINPDSIAANYTWSLPLGWLGSSVSNSIVATSNDTGGVISVTANNALCGVSIPQTITIGAAQIPGKDICIATVDSSSVFNVITWQKNDIALVDSYFIYRQMPGNIYTKVGSQAVAALSRYEDYGANPNDTSYTYKLSILDTCGHESPLGDYHSTLYLKDAGGGNFQWTQYKIEGDTAFVSLYNIYRDSLNTGNFTHKTSLPGNNTTYSDTDSYLFPNAAYYIDVSWNRNCDSTNPIKTTRSNIAHLAGYNSIAILHGAGDNFTIYPNPATYAITLNFAHPVIMKEVKMFNLLGEIVYEETSVNIYTARKQLNIEQLAKGIYMVLVETDKGMEMSKLVIQ